MPNVLRCLLVLGLVFAASGAAAKAGEPDINGLWRGSMYGSDVQASIERAGKDVKAVVVVHSLNGETNMYHFFGEMENGRLRLTHNSGHVFVGQAESDSVITGVLTTGGGTRLDIRATRVPAQAPPAASDPPQSGQPGHRPS